MSNAHITVLLNESVDALLQYTGGARAHCVFADGTFGRGGHSRLILHRLNEQGRLIGIDRDPEAVAVGKTWNDARFTMVQAAFSEMKSVLSELHQPLLDGLLLDLGVSSPQLDVAARGFSFNKDAPLDMRMDCRVNSPSMTAAQWINSADEADIANVLWQYGEERQSRRIAANIVAQRTIAPIDTTLALAKIVEQSVRTRIPGHHPATRTFQAVRMHVNQELQELDAVLAQAESCIKPGGRLAIISFHSLEDRRVKQAFRPAPEDAQIRHLPIPAKAAAHPWRAIAKIKPDAAACKAKPRARSAVLRVEERVA